MIILTETGKQLEAVFGRRLWQLGLSIKDMEDCGLIEKSCGIVTTEELRTVIENLE